MTLIIDLPIWLISIAQDAGLIALGAALAIGAAALVLYFVPMGPRF